MARFKRARYTSTLPPTPCTDEMRDSLVGLATQQNKSLAELQRESLALFLQKNVGEASLDGQPLAVGVDHTPEEM